MSWDKTEAGKAYHARYRAEKADKIRVYQAGYRILNRERLRAQKAKRHKETYVRNPRVALGRDPVKKRANDARRRSTNAIAVNASIRASKRKRPELYRELDRIRAQRRRARVRSLEVGAVTMAQIFKRDAGVCHLCREPVVLPETKSLDHLIPVCRSGPFVEWNLCLAHVDCNRRRRETNIIGVETEGNARAYVQQRSTIL